MARASLDQGRATEAIDLYQVSIRLASHFKTLELLGETLVAEKRETEGLLYLAASVGLGRNQSRARFLLAKLLVEQERPQDALRLLDEALAINPVYRAATELRSR